MKKTAYNFPFLQRCFYLLGWLFLKLIGWRTEGTLPDIPKQVIIAAPHTSNWDFPIGMAIAFIYRLDFRWMGKKEIFRGPFNPLLRWLGGIPIDRQSSDNIVSEAVTAIKREKTFLLALSPEGTRQKVARWKSGFYYIALGADVPILLGFLDAGRKVGGFGPLFYPTGNYESDLNAIQGYYSSIQGRHS